MVGWREEGASRPTGRRDRARHCRFWNGHSGLCPSSLLRYGIGHMCMHRKRRGGRRGRPGQPSRGPVPYTHPGCPRTQRPPSSPLPGQFAVQAALSATCTHTSCPLPPCQTLRPKLTLPPTPPPAPSLPPPRPAPAPTLSGPSRSSWQSTSSRSTHQLNASDSWGCGMRRRGKGLRRARTGARWLHADAGSSRYKRQQSTGARPQHACRFRQ